VRQEVDQASSRFWRGKNQLISFVSVTDLGLDLGLHYSRHHCSLEREALMFTSVVECILKPHEKDHFDELLRGRILRHLRKDSGFVDLLAIASDSRGERMLAVTVWRTRADADRYEIAHLAELVTILKPLVVQGSHVAWGPADSLNEIGRGLA
jgi:hypothetical protein